MCSVLATKNMSGTTKVDEEAEAAAGGQEWIAKVVILFRWRAEVKMWARVRGHRSGASHLWGLGLGCVTLHGIRSVQ